MDVRLAKEGGRVELRSAEPVVGTAATIAAVAPV